MSSIPILPALTTLFAGLSFSVSDRDKVKDPYSSLFINALSGLTAAICVHRLQDKKLTILRFAALATFASVPVIVDLVKEFCEMVPGIKTLERAQLISRLVEATFWSFSTCAVLILEGAFNPAQRAKNRQIISGLNPSKQGFTQVIKNFFSSPFLELARSSVTSSLLFNNTYRALTLKRSEEI